MMLPRSQSHKQAWHQFVTSLTVTGRSACSAWNNTQYLNDSVPQGNLSDLPSVGFAGWSLLIAVWMLLKEAGGPHCCSTPMALQNWSASCRMQRDFVYQISKAISTLFCPPAHENYAQTPQLARSSGKGPLAGIVGGCRGGKRLAAHSERARKEPAQAKIPPWWEEEQLPRKKGAAALPSSPHPAAAWACPPWLSWAGRGTPSGRQGGACASFRWVGHGMPLLPVGGDGDLFPVGWATPALCRPGGGLHSPGQGCYEASCFAATGAREQLCWGRRGTAARWEARRGRYWDKREENAATRDT